MKKYIIHTGWKLKPKLGAFILYSSDHKSKEEEIFELNQGKNITIIVEDFNFRFCVGYSESSGERNPCPRAMQLDIKRNQCQFCNLNEFYLCRIMCQGDICHPSSEEAHDYCWKTKAYVYLTYIAGKLKVGSSTNPFRRWLGQGSDAGIVIAEGVGLAPRALEHAIGQKITFSMAIRTSQKLKLLGSEIDKKIIKSEINTAIEDIYSTTNSDILLPKEKLDPIMFLDEFYGGIPEITDRPIIKESMNGKFTFSGEIIGVKGSVLVIKNKQTYYAFNIQSLVGTYATINEELEEMDGQKSLFDFV